MTYTTAILGASGYAGGELVRLADDHPDLEVVHLGAYTKAGERLGSVHPHLPGADRTLGSNDPADLPDVDLVFMALPHGASAAPGAALADRGLRVVDLGSDYRMDTAARYAAAYGTDHPHPERLADWTYGIPELFGEAIATSSTVAAPGCYPTSAILALAPLVTDRLIAPDGIVVNSLSGVTGAGRSLKPDLLYGAVDESVKAYAVGTHRHRPEIEQGIEHASGASVSVVFTPHLVPMQRGILSTITARPSGTVTPDHLNQALRAAYKGAPFVEVIDVPPQTRWVAGSNRCLLWATIDEPTGTVIVLSAIDNLLKGAAGQAVQCANVMLGLAETAGLPIAGWLP
jgi:N-acetyl-gamma-glutamyl-phosphate reductase